jgi:hypothetical protein
MESTILDLFHAIDALDWEEVRSALDDRVEVDYTSLFGGEASAPTGDELIESWQGVVPGFDATQHLLGPLRIEERARDAASAETHVRAYHYLEDSVWMVAGHYRIALTRRDGAWKIAGIRLDVFYQEGGPDLLARAQERALAFPRVSGRDRSER